MLAGRPLLARSFPALGLDLHRSPSDAVRVGAELSALPAESSDPVSAPTPQKPPTTLFGTLTKHPSILAWTIGLGAVGYFASQPLASQMPTAQMRAGGYLGGAVTMGLIGFIVGLVRAEGIG